MPGTSFKILSPHSSLEKKAHRGRGREINETRLTKCSSSLKLGIQRFIIQFPLLSISEIFHNKNCLSPQEGREEKEEDERELKKQLVPGHAHGPITPPFSTPP
jgi:hypothetical protein